MVKVLVADFDKTYYLDNLDIQKNNELVKEFRNNGKLFVIATGRSYYDFLKKKNKYNVLYDYVLLNHGATILDNQDNVLFNFPIKENPLKIKEFLELSKSILYFCCSALESRVDFNYKDLTKIAVRYLPLVDIPKIKNNLDNNFKNINVYLVSSNLLEIISSDIDKSKAISLLINKLNISKDNVYTIGDSYTDINMINDFNGSIMTNSIDELKKLKVKQYKSVSNLIKDIM